MATWISVILHFLLIIILRLDALPHHLDHHIWKPGTHEGHPPGHPEGPPEEPHIASDDDLFEGDIAGFNPFLRNSIKHKAGHWNWGEVPYKIDPKFSGEEVGNILAAMDHIAKLSSCITFKERKSQTNYVVIRKHKKKCYSNLGRQNKIQAQFLDLTSRCAKDFVTTVHELMHTLGFLHEQNRPDRDSYVKILLENIQKGEDKNFRKWPRHLVDFNEPYDYQSVMHYKSKAFSKNNRPTIVSKRPGIKEFGNKNGLTRLDIIKLKRMYKCP